MDRKHLNVSRVLVMGGVQSLRILGPSEKRWSCCVGLRERRDGTLMRYSSLLLLIRKKDGFPAICLKPIRMPEPHGWCSSPNKSGATWRMDKQRRGLSSSPQSSNVRKACRERNCTLEIKQLWIMQMTAYFVNS